MTEPSELRGAITKEEAGEVAVVLSDEIYRLSSAAQMGYEQSDAEFFAPRAERLDRRAEYLRSIRAKLLAPSVPEPPNRQKEIDELQIRLSQEMVKASLAVIELREFKR